MSECLQLDKEDDGGRWVLTWEVPGEPTVQRLRIAVTGPWDWFEFVAEMQVRGEPPVTLGTFELAVLEIIPRQSDRFGNRVAEPWNPEESADFLTIPAAYQRTFEIMVRKWGQLAGLMVPAIGWRTVH